MHGTVADRLAQLYEQRFGGRDRGRYRISLKLLRELAGRRRLYADDIRDIGRELFERGYILIDMETYFAVLGQRTLASYRRINAERLFEDSAGPEMARGSRPAGRRRGKATADGDTDAGR